MTRYLKTFLLLAVVASGSFAQTSRNGEFSASVTTSGGAKDRNDHNTWSARIIDRNGKARYEISRDIPFDMQFPSVYVADDGSSIVVYVFVGAVDFYDSRGKLIRTLGPFGKKTAEHEQIIKCSVAGKRAAFLISTPESKYAQLFVTDLGGDELWRKYLRGKNAGEIMLSSDSKLLVAGSYEVNAKPQHFAELFGEDGQALRTLNASFRFADFLPDGRFVFSDRNSVTIASLVGDEAGRTWNTGHKEKIVTALKVVDNIAACAVEQVRIPNGTPAYIDPTLVLLNEEAQVLGTTQINASSQHPSVISTDGKHVRLTSEAKQASIPIPTGR
ncbi:MAG: hypothetical protein HY961_11165 [Ignavibacteriae bacterium]|nr:hypothetical protein [Ignavibacteriota bacterium]